MQSKKVRDILDIDFFGKNAIGNQKFYQMCADFGIDLHDVGEFAKKRKYARYYKSIIQEPQQNAYTYKLKQRVYADFYGEDIVANEWSNNRMYFDFDSFFIYDGFRDALGTGIWFAFSLAKELMDKKESFDVILSYFDIYDKLARYEYNYTDEEDWPGEDACEDSVNVTFCRRPTNGGIMSEAQLEGESPYCWLLIHC